MRQTFGLGAIWANHESATLDDPLATDYRRLHASFAVGARLGFDAMAAHL